MKDFAVSNMWSLYYVICVAIFASTFGVEGVPLHENLFSKHEGGMIPMGEGRIIGGNYAPIETVPWTCSLQRLGSHRCGCAIITPTVTLTAARCTYQIPGNGFEVRAGSASKSRDGQLVPTRDVSIHPTFNDENLMEHDMCVVFLASALNTALPTVSVITMTAGGTSLPSGTMSMVSGWGPLYENGTGSEILRSVTHPVFSSLECSQRYGGVTTHDMLCAGLDAGGAAACDPGSPLISGNVLIGVMSWSIGCGRPNLPSIYSRVSTARFWIEFAMSSNS